eukprot:TRINITY_DN23899_c0_g1_i1.p1 TRINITY_DN23899_c0_g1~~TRINITY_DN23899_c0_g1_i1.p1  ORF type:complete len:185 (-),score=30.89 TRINITY_DN23899_c0_g1_i1:74-628(-)
MGRGRRRSPSYSYDYSDYSRSPSRKRGKKSRKDSRGRGGGRRRGGGGKRSTLDKFIEENELNESAESRLRGTSREVQDMCIDQGWNVIDNSRNPSAVVISRIKKIEDSLRDGGRGKGRGRDRSRSRSRGGDRGDRGSGGGQFRDGDWNCSKCGAHNFARRNECFKCHAPKDGSPSRSRSRSRRR